MANNRESDRDRALRQHSEAVREERTQLANDRRIEQGLTPKHCGMEVSINRHGDYVCRKCGAIF
ncbi:hypothetical protein ACIBAC_11510 [Streptomyces sp. NPDC051362]|uniref:hypothetical protein n=1 Tax=Streptomyces sp. NPDC051362 TaxID=3365651 RepID=UPI00378ADBCE